MQTRFFVGVPTAILRVCSYFSTNYSETSTGPKKFIEDYVPKNKLTIQEASEWLLTILENDSNKNNDNYLGKNSFDNKAQIGILSEITSLLKSSDFAFNKETKQIIDRVQNLYNNNLQSRSLLGRTNNDDKPLEQAIKDSLFRLELENNLLDKTLTKDLPKEKRDWNNETEENWLIIDKFLGEKKTSLPRKPISLADFKLRLLENYCQPQMDKNPQAGTIKDLRILLIEDILKNIKDDDFPFEKKENYFRVLKNKIGNLRTLPKEWVKKAVNEIKRLSVHSERRKLLDSLNYKKSFFGDIYNKNLSVNISLEKTKELTKQFLEDYVPKNKLTIQEASEWLLTLLENDSNKNNDNYLGKNSFDNKAQIHIMSEIATLMKNDDLYSERDYQKSIINRVDVLYNNNLKSIGLWKSKGIQVENPIKDIQEKLYFSMLK